MEKIPTAEEILREYNTHTQESDWRTIVAMKEFAKLHVEAALIGVSQITHKNGIPRIIDNKDSILNSYPLDNIK